MDAIFEALRAQGAKEALLVAWGVDDERRKHLLHLAVGNKEPGAAWAELLANLLSRVDGLEATRRLSSDKSLDGTKVLIVTTSEADEYVYEALRAGASGFILKDTEPADLVQAVRVVARGDALLSPSVTRRLISDIALRRAPLAQRHEHAKALGGLTEREREVVALVGQGLSNEEIAKKLFVSPLAAKTHVSRAMMELGTRERAQLVVFAYETGLVVPGGR